jgi:hypothetical protein
VIIGSVTEVMAKGWISGGIPTIYRFSQEENTTFFPVSKRRGTPSGYIIHGSIYDIPFIGYEAYKIALDADNSDEDAALIEITFYDIGLRFDQKYAQFAAGYGYGTIKTDCQISTCNGIDFEEGIARQLFIQLGAELVNDFYFHLSAHWINGQSDMSFGTETDPFVIDGSMLAFGVNLKW